MVEHYSNRIIDVEGRSGGVANARVKQTVQIIRLLLHQRLSLQSQPTRW